MSAVTGKATGVLSAPLAGCGAGAGLVSGAVRRVEDRVSGRVGGIVQGAAGVVGLSRAIAGPVALIGLRMAGQAVGQAAASASVVADGVADVGRLALRAVLSREPQAAERAPSRPVAVLPLEEPLEEPEERGALRAVDEALAGLADEQAAVPGPAQEAVEAGAPGTATAVADLAARRHPDVVVPQHESELPLPEWDGRPPASLRARIRNLPLEDLLVLRAWEQQHAHRLQVLTSLENRIRKVEADQLVQGEPSEG